MTPLGSPAPAFSLPDFGVNGQGGRRVVSRSDFPRGTPLLVMFICNHCPFVVFIQDELARLAHAYAGRGVAVVAINANDATTHPEDAPEKMTERARAVGYNFPYLYDETQEVARAFGAACTPDFFLYDGEHRLVYRGQLDESRPSNGLPITGADLRAALDAVLEGRPVNPDQKPAIGCGIKWKPGHAPA
jgi:thiol-disulfide isomerase/thioredoxin